MERTIRCVAIDDEPLALEVIEKFCARIGGIEIKMFCRLGERACMRAGGGTGHRVS